MTLNGDAQSFDASAQDTFKTKLAGMFVNVAASDVVLTVGAQRRRLQTGSFIVAIQIRMPSSSYSTWAANMLTTSSTAYLSSTLGVDVNSFSTPETTSIAIAAPSPTPPALPQPPPPTLPLADAAVAVTPADALSGDGDSSQGGAGGGLVAVAVGLVICVLGIAIYWHLSRRSKARGQAAAVSTPTGNKRAPPYFDGVEETDVRIDSAKTIASDARIPPPPISPARKTAVTALTGIFAKRLERARDPEQRGSSTRAKYLNHDAASVSVVAATPARMSIELDGDVEEQEEQKDDGPTTPSEAIM